MTKVSKMPRVALVLGLIFLGGAARAAETTQHPTVAAPATVAPNAGGEVVNAGGEVANADGPVVNVRPWTVRAELSLLGTHDGGFFPREEAGVTIGRTVTSRLSLEGTATLAATGSARTSWSAMANARWDLLRTNGGHHALAVAGGPLVVTGNGVHGTTPLGHAELAYVYRAPFGFTALAGFGENVALTDSDYVPPSSCFLSCPQAIHRGDIMPEARVALGWMF